MSVSSFINPSLFQSSATAEELASQSQDSPRSMAACLPSSPTTPIAWLDHLESSTPAYSSSGNPGLFKAREPETMGFEAAVWVGGLAPSGEQRVNESDGPDRRGRTHSGGEQSGFFPVAVGRHKTLIQVRRRPSLAHTWHGGIQPGNSTCTQTDPPLLSSPFLISSLTLESFVFLSAESLSDTPVYLETAIEGPPPPRLSKAENLHDSPRPAPLP